MILLSDKLDVYVRGNVNVCSTVCINVSDWVRGVYINSYPSDLELPGEIQMIGEEEGIGFFQGSGRRGWLIYELNVLMGYLREKTQ